MKRHSATLERQERRFTKHLIRKGRSAAHKLTDSRLLLQVDSRRGQWGWTHERTAQGLEFHLATVANAHRQYVEYGSHPAPNPAKRAPTSQTVRRCGTPSDCLSLYSGARRA